MRIAVDATTAAVQFAGIGRYTRELLSALMQIDTSDRYLLLSASTSNEAERLLRDLPPGAWREVHRMPASERVMTAIWHRLRIPLPVDLLTGGFDVFHGPDFVVPPSRRPSVMTVHDLSYIVAPQYSEPALVEYLRVAVPRSIERASQIITVSASVAAELVDAYPQAAGRVRAIPNGVRPQPRRRNRDQASGPPTILTVGTIEPRKNLTTLLVAMRNVWETEPDARLVVAGRVGWQSDQIMNLLTTACKTSNVEFVNAPSDAVVDALYDAADLFVYPSAYEGFGLPLLEAMTRDVPVVTSDISALRETAGPAACYVDAFDAEALGAAILRVMGDEHLAFDLVSAGRQRVDEHPWSETARRTRLAYYAAADGRI